MTPEELKELVEERDQLRQDLNGLTDQLKNLVRIEHALTRSRRSGERQLERIRRLAQFAFDIAGGTETTQVFSQARLALLDQFELDDVEILELDAAGTAARVGDRNVDIGLETWRALGALPTPGIEEPAHPVSTALLDIVRRLDANRITTAPQVVLWVPVRSRSTPSATVLVGWSSRKTAHHRDLPNGEEHLPFLGLFGDHITRALDTAHFTSELRRQGAELAESNDQLKNSLHALERTQAQLVQAQKLEALGRLAGGIAHDFNNLLTVIVSHADLIRSEVQDLPEVSADVSVIIDAAQRATEITRRLLAFGRRQKEHQREVVDLNALVIDLSKMLSRLLSDDIVVQLDLDPGVGRVQADAIQLEQIVMNLVVNARDAMPEGGRLTIETRHARQGDLPGELSTTTANFIALSVRDTGVGMDEATRKQLFEPFFTTKPVGKGTGLGLATVYGLVKQAKGHINVDSVPGKGSCFTVTIPSAEGISGADLRAPIEAPKGHVLVVEDEDAIRRMVCRVLRKRGFEVHEARNGSEALTAAKGLNVLDLVVTDVVMPAMGGRDMVTRLREARPRLKVVYMSGHTFDRLDTSALDEELEVFLPKPFTAEDVRRTVEKAVDRDGREQAPTARALAR